MKISRITVWQLDLPLTKPYWLSGGRLRFDKLDSVAQAIRAAGVEADAYTCNVSDPEQVALLAYPWSTITPSRPIASMFGVCTTPATPPPLSEMSL